MPSRSERIAQYIARRITANRTRLRFSSLHEEALQIEYQKENTMTSFRDVPNTKVPDTHGQPQPGGIAGDIHLAVGVTTLEGSYKNSGDHGNGQNEDGAERVAMPPQRDPRAVKPADPKTFN